MESLLIPLALQIYAARVPSAPPALLLAQVRQESAWNPRARSPVGAVGLTQFMPATLRWVAVTNGLGNPDPFNPRDALTLQAVYMNLLHRGNAKADTECDRWLLSLSDYNGGAGWRMKRQARSSAPGDYFITSDINPGIAAGNQKENREYPRRIFLGQSRYSTYGVLKCQPE